MTYYIGSIYRLTWNFLYYGSFSLRFSWSLTFFFAKDVAKINVSNVINTNENIVDFVEITIYTQHLYIAPVIGWVGFWNQQEPVYELHAFIILELDIRKDYVETYFSCFKNQINCFYIIYDVNSKLCNYSYRTTLVHCILTLLHF